jgi:serine/threonine-protein kinase
MAVLDPLILPPDVLIVPVDKLDSEVRAQIEHRAGDFSVTRPRSRTTSSIVDAKTAALLEAFRTPATIVDAVIALSAAEGLDPQTTLEDAFPVIRGFVNEGLLVAADSPLAQRIETSLAAGDPVGAFAVVEPAQVIVDTEVYLARGPDGAPVALKLARPGSESRVRGLFAHEAQILAALDGRVSPRLLEHGEFDGRPLLAMSWCAGADVFQAAAEARGLGGDAGRDVVLDLAEHVIAAYAHLHEQGVLHGDVHPRNVLVDAAGAITLIDFGFAATGQSGQGWRAGVDFFMEPELARARLEGRTHSALSRAGEQYSIAALVFLVLTGAHTHAFSLEEEEMLRQLAGEPPQSFERLGTTGLPAVERVLARALAKDPDARFDSVAALLRAFRRAAAEDRSVRPTPSAGAREPGPAGRLLDEVLARLAVPGELAEGGLAAPTASVMNGAAGFAYALLRIAGIRADAMLLGTADLWAVRARLASGSDEAFWSPELDIVPETFGHSSLYHTASGVHCVEALVARARGDEWSQREALDAFVAAARQPCEHVDVAFGRAGLLLGCSLLLEASALDGDDGSLRSLGDDLRDSLWEEVDAHPPVAESTELRLLGAAHGWAGILYATLRWSEARGTPAPEGLGERLEQLAALGRPAGRGLRWPHEIGAETETGLEASWCNGAAGFVHLWTLAHRSLGDEGFARLAGMAAWSTYEGPPAPGDLCCGLAGRAYALLRIYQHTDEPAWLARARDLTDRAAVAVGNAAMRRDSLYKGEVGVALLAAELEAPHDACMPLFATEGWPRGRPADRR